MITSYQRIAQREAELSAFILEHGTKLTEAVEIHGINLRSDGVMIDFHRKDLEQVQAALGVDGWFKHPAAMGDYFNFHKCVGPVTVRILDAEPQSTVANIIFDALTEGNRELSRRSKISLGGQGCNWTCAR